jgi:hypothetical protein
MDVIPAISTSVVGPLNVMHVPRLWLKNLLFAMGRLAPGYKHTTGTFDRMVIDTLGIDEDAMLAFFAVGKPDYLAFEAWLKQYALHLDAAVIADLNRRFRESLMSECGAETRRLELGLTDPAQRNGILLNDLDDWAGMHRLLLGHPMEQ